jgi:7-carboxy-7-deazaguanine synthase
MFGDNPIRPPEKGDGSELLVQEIFPTLQGEGPMAGWPSVFVRLGGCNLACHFCDTEFESFQPMAMAELLAEVRAQALNDEGARVRNLVVITGGEPLRQNIVPFCEALLAAGFDVQIETNGTLWRPLPDAVHVICSPKAGTQGYAPIRGDVLARVAGLKFIVTAQEGLYHAVPEVGQTEAGVPVYVQPMDEQDEAKNAANTAHALALAQQHGYRLSLQTHKFLHIR